MTREEENREKEITQAAESEYFPTMSEMFAYMHGAEWADEHPKKGLWDADKVIEWIKSNEIYYEHDDVDIFVDDLRKAMEN